ncbi:MAG: glycosyltransferase family 9 protein, partial [Desulfobacteraceae bacterium]|nr:glycosyltransferase family 9 protein [Desulfobacteraceae bacterium]
MADRPYSGPEPRKILIIKPSAFGDIIHGLPVLHALSRRYPAARIHWVAAKGLHEILEGHPLIEKLWVFDKNAWKKFGNLPGTFCELRALAASLRAERFDLVVDLQGLFRSAIIGLLAGTGERAGFESAREGAKYTYKYRVKTPAELHAVDKNMLVARFLGCDAAEPVFPLPPLGPFPAILAQFPQYAVLAPSAGTLVKRWPAERFGRLASSLPIASVV